MSEKYCAKCCEFKSVAEFHKKKATKDGLQCNCKSCVVEMGRKYYKANREEIAEHHRRYNEANREKVAERARKYYEANKEMYAEMHKKYREANKEKVLESGRKYYEANKEKVLESQRKYYTDKRATDNFWNTLKMAEAVGGKLSED